MRESTARATYVEDPRVLLEVSIPEAEALMKLLGCMSENSASKAMSYGYGEEPYTQNSDKARLALGLYDPLHDLLRD